MVPSPRPDQRPHPHRSHPPPRALQIPRALHPASAFPGPTPGTTSTGIKEVGPSSVNSYEGCCEAAAAVDGVEGFDEDRDAVWGLEEGAEIYGDDEGGGVGVWES